MKTTINKDMKKLANPYKDLPGYNCFGCSPYNKLGLQMEFYEDGDYITCEWDPKQYMQGYINVLHGGIQSTMLDEIANWVVNVKVKTAGVTSKLDIKLLKPVYTNKGKLKARAKLIEMKRNIAVIEAELIDSDAVVTTKGTIYFFTYSEQMAKEKLQYPGHEAFYELE